MATNKEDAKAHADRIKKFGLPFIAVRWNNTRDHEKEAALKEASGQS